MLVDIMCNKKKGNSIKATPFLLQMNTNTKQIYNNKLNTNNFYYIIYEG
mgnify:CR=1 FL=1